jgi:hypothetical protein
MDNRHRARKRLPLLPIPPLPQRGGPVFLHVTGVQRLHDSCLWIHFSNGAVRDVDLARERFGVVFEPLRDPAFFARVAVNPETGTLEWPNGADFAPEFLFQMGTSTGRVA